jgi:hypothetical protein
MDPKMFEINNLRVLNDYLNQTIDVLVRAQRFGVIPGVGLSHSPFGVSNFVNTIPGVAAGIGLDPTVGGLSHSPFLAHTTPFAAAAYGATPFAASALANVSPFAPTYAGVVDPFIAQRGLSHTAGFANPLWQQAAAWSPFAEIARQQQIAQALAARAQMLEAMVRGGGFGI